MHGVHAKAAMLSAMFCQDGTGQRTVDFAILRATKIRNGSSISRIVVTSQN